MSCPSSWSFSSRHYGFSSASSPRSSECDTPLAGSGLCPCRPDLSPTSGCSCGERGAPPAGSDMPCCHCDPPLSTSGLCFGCASEDSAPPSSQGQRLCLRKGAAVLLSYHGLHLAAGPCYDGRVAPLAVLGPKSRSSYAPDACIELLSFCHTLSGCGRSWAPGSCFRATRPNF